MARKTLAVFWIPSPGAFDDCQSARDRFAAPLL
jgi:hypothetical protein